MKQFEKKNTAEGGRNEFDHAEWARESCVLLGKGRGCKGLRDFEWGPGRDIIGW